MNIMNKNEITAQIGQTLKRARKRKHLTQQDISDRTGISRSVIGRYETGMIEISISNFIAICDAIGCDPALIIMGTDK